VALPDGRAQDIALAPTVEHVEIGNAPRWLPPIEGTIVGALLNYRGELDALGDTLFAPPYQASPKAPILYLKPANTRVVTAMMSCCRQTSMPSGQVLAWA